MKYVQYLIDQVRSQTENTDFTDFTGIPTSEFIQYINDAQHSLQAAITAQHPRVFMKEATIDIVNGQEKYDIPSDCYLGNKIHNVEYSATGAEDDFYVLDDTTIKSRVPGITGAPIKYIRMSGKIMLVPQATSGKLRINYIKRIREVDLRRAKVASVPTVSSTANWTIALDNANFLTETSSLQQHDYVSIVDRKGDILASNLPVINVGDEYIDIEPHTLQSGESIPANAFVVGGKDTSSHGEFDDSVERYIIAYCAWKILKRDSSEDSGEAAQELTIMLQDIVKSYALITDDVQTIPNLHSWDDWSF